MLIEWHFPYIGHGRFIVDFEQIFTLKIMTADGQKIDR